jgi:hypothetical protein
MIRLLAYLQSAMLILLAVVLGLLLAGCTAYATYRAPSPLFGDRAMIYRRDEVTCVRGMNRPGWGWLGLLTSPFYVWAEIEAGADYADCKSAMEAKGWERIK